MSRIRRLQHRIDLLDGAVAEVPRISMSASLTMLVAMWAIVTIYDLISGEPELLRIILPIAALVPFFIRILRPIQLDDDREAYDTYVRLTILSSITLVAILIAQIIPFDGSGEGMVEGAWDLLLARVYSLVPLLTVPPLAETLLRLQRYRSRRSVPRIAVLVAYGFITAIVLEQIFHASSDWTPGSATPGAAIAGLVALGALILSVRARWIINLRKRQKLAILGLSFAGIMVGAWIIGVHQDNHDFQLAVFNFFPGLAILTFTVGLTLVVMHAIFFLQVLIALPTAGAMDRRSIEISSLATFGRLLTRSFDIRDLVDTSLAIACDVTGGVAAWIELTRNGADGESPSHANTGDVLCGSANCISEVDARTLMQMPIDGVPLQRAVLASRSMQLIDRATIDHAPEGSLARETGSIAASPLIAGANVIGTLYVTKPREAEFDREDLAFLKSVADQIALATEHSRLISSSIERERIEQEMLIARDLQKRLLPRSMPQSRWFEISAESRPADLVGGDYYDLVSFSDGSLGIVIGDVSGKGASAALYMGMIKGVLQALSGSAADPGELLSKINVALHGQIDQRWFATMTCAQVIEHQRVLRIARAGHCPTLVISSGVAQYRRSRGLGLALARPILFERHLELDEVHFSSDDYVVFFSDGLPESRSPEGEEFGYDRLLDTVVRSAAMEPSPSQLRDAIFTELSAFTRGQMSGDDTTVVVLRWKACEGSDD